MAATNIMVMAMVSQMCVMFVSSLAFGHDTPQNRRPYMGQPSIFRIRLSVRSVATKLGAQHDATGGGVKGIAAVDHAPVVPHDKVTGAPDMFPGKRWFSAMFPQAVEQGFAFPDCHAFDPGVAASAQIE